MLKYMYVDESGDLGERKGTSKYLVISALLVDNPSDLDRIVKNMRRNKFRKELRKISELKGNKLKKDIVLHALDKLRDVEGIQIFHMILEKKKLYSSFLKGDKHKCYNFIAGKLARNIILNGVDVEIRIDKSKGKQVLRADFNRHFEKCLRERSDIQKIKIEHSYSESWSGLQFADLLAWAAFQKVERNNPEYIDVIGKDQEVYNVW